jgi:hypothetical protein
VQQVTAVRDALGSELMGKDKKTMSKVGSNALFRELLIAF